MKTVTEISHIYSELTSSTVKTQKDLRLDYTWEVQHDAE